MNIYNFSTLRKFFLPILLKYNRDISIKHHWLANEEIKYQKIKLNLFKHKGYWYHGKRREHKSMILFQELIQTNSTVIEVGGHIGYISLYFNKLVGSNGKVIVFEPGTNNMPYIEKNVYGCSQITLIKKAIGDKIGVIEFYEDNLTGQNNSIVKDFNGLIANAKNAFVPTEINKVIAEMTTLDFEFLHTKVDFIKIDIEGGEWAAICGAANLIKLQQPAIMIEIQANENEIYNLLISSNYILFNESREIITTPNQLKGNTFCLHKERHLKLITKLFPNL